MANNQQVSSTPKTLPTPLDPTQLLEIKGGDGGSTPPIPPQDVVIEDIVNG